MSGGDVWSKAIGGAVIVNACTLVGTILLGLSALKLSGTNIIQATAVASGFAGGVLLAAAIFLILPESLHLIAEDYSDETEVNYRFGIMVLVGFIVVLFLDVLVASIVKASMRKRAAQAPTDLETDLPTKDKESAVDEVTQYENARVLAAVVAGDAMHNFADGVFIASAFQLCSSTVGWIIVVSTIAHELPQVCRNFLHSLSWRICCPLRAKQHLRAHSSRERLVGDSCTMLSKAMQKLYTSQSPRCLISNLCRMGVPHRCVLCRSWRTLCCSPRWSTSVHSELSCSTSSQA